MPDFGYNEDNYILSGHNSNKWKLLVGILNDQEKFKWLMSYIKVQQLRKVVSKAKETEVLKNQREIQIKLEQEMQMRKLEELAANRRVIKGQAEINDLYRLQEES